MLEITQRHKKLMGNGYYIIKETKLTYELKEEKSANVHLTRDECAE